MLLRFSTKLDRQTRDSLEEVLGRLPELVDGHLELAFQPQLTAHRGRLLSGKPVQGKAVHAAAFIRERRIVLDSHLLQKPRDLRLILVHEVFHFIWPRLGSKVRKTYYSLLLAELQCGARGELGESAAVSKSRIGVDRGALRPTEVPPDYACESFCDTAAWLYSGVKRHPEFTLALRWQRKRGDWFSSVFASGTRRC